MDNHPYFEEAEVKERFGRAYREAEQWRLGQLSKAHDDDRQGQWLPTSKALWDSFVALAGRAADSARVGLSEARSWWSESRKPQEQCC